MATIEEKTEAGHKFDRIIKREYVKGYNDGYLKGYMCGRNGVNEAMEDKIADLRYEMMDCASKEVGDEVCDNE